MGLTGIVNLYKKQLSTTILDIQLFARKKEKRNENLANLTKLIFKTLKKDINKQLPDSMKKMKKYCKEK